MTNPKHVRMRIIEKRYVVPYEIGTKSLVWIYFNLDACNSRKMGRHRRGKVRLVGFHGNCTPEGKYMIRLDFAIGGSPYIRVPNGGKFQAFNFQDFRQLLRSLAKADASR